METPALPHSASRYSRQTLFPPIGESGQAKLLAARVALIGCGALGASAAEMLARAGVGTLILLDRDIVEPSNLGRQALYTAADAAESLPKAVALARHLERINPEIAILPRVTDLRPQTIDQALAGADLLIDGTDNLETRYLINEWAVRESLPWIYGACVAARGMSAVLWPGVTPCLACWFPEAPARGSLETCDTSGIIAPAATLIASLQVAEALKIVVGDRAALRTSLLSIELWPYRHFELLPPAEDARAECPVCAKREFPRLAQLSTEATIRYCGRDAVQLIPEGVRAQSVDFTALRARLAGRFDLRANGYVLQLRAPEATLTLFDDGRVLVTGVSDPERARALRDRYFGG